MEEPISLTFDDFWSWVVAHPNCILRAGTPEAVIFDDDDLHWHFATQEDGIPVVQVLRGKRLMGELFLIPDQISFVQGMVGEENDEYVFELISETEDEGFAAYFFVLVHGFDGESEFTPSRVH
jgi:hypothetical protein